MDCLLPSKLEEILSVQENSAPTFFCPSCKHSTETRQDLESHIKRIHVNPIELPYVKLNCPVCAYQVPHDRASFMAEHIEGSGHLGEVSFHWKDFIENEETRVRSLLGLYVEARRKNPELKPKPKRVRRRKRKTDQKSSKTEKDEKDADKDEEKPDLKESEDVKFEVVVPKPPRDPLLPHECPECEKAFPTRRKFTKHRSQTHFHRQCPYCPKSYTPNNMTTHIKRKHLTDELRPEDAKHCDQCDIKFYTGDHLFRHIITVHSTEEEKENLRIQVIHNRVSGLNFLFTKCVACDQLFRSFHEMNKHCKRDHYAPALKLKATPLLLPNEESEFEGNSEYIIEKKEEEVDVS